MKNRSIQGSLLHIQLHSRWEKAAGNKKRWLLIILATVAGTSHLAQAQVGWVDVAHKYGMLPSGVQVFENKDSIEGKPNRSIYISLPLRQKSLRYSTQVTTGSRKTPQQFYDAYRAPLVVVNGTFFSFATNSNLNVVINKKKLLAYNVASVQKKGDSLHSYISRSAIGIGRGGRADVAWLYTDSTQRRARAFEQAPISGLRGSKPAPLWKEMKPMLKAAGMATGKAWRVHTAIGGGPMLVHQGAVRITNKEEWMFATGEHDRHPRTAMGYTADGRLIILMTEGRRPGQAEGISLVQMAHMLVQLGCVEALNLDGGGSSCMLINGIETITPSDKEGQRPVPAVWMVHWK